MLLGWLHRSFLFLLHFVSFQQASRILGFYLHCTEYVTELFLIFSSLSHANIRSINVPLLS
jgi:hypothetical protein